MGRWIEHQRAILDFTLSSLWRRKWKNLALMVVYTLVIFSLASVLFFAQALKKEAAIILRGYPGDHRSKAHRGQTRPDPHELCGKRSNRSAG